MRQGEHAVLSAVWLTCDRETRSKTCGKIPATGDDTIPLTGTYVYSTFVTLYNTTLDVTSLRGN